MRSAPKATIYLDKRNPLSNGVYPVTLRIYYRKKARFYRIRGEFKNIPGFTEKEFEKIFSRKAPAELKKYKSIFEAVELKANQIISELEFF